jgi:transcriptional regulator with XRE-family HTH domain
MASTEVEKLMAATGLQVQEICAALDIAPATLNRYKRGLGAMPQEKLEQLRALAGGARPALRQIGSAKPIAVTLADVPATAMIEELARRARGGRLKETGIGSLDVARPLRSVAFTDVEDD